MGGFTITQVDQLVNNVGQKRVILRATGPASYDTGGSVLALDTSVSILGKEYGFPKVFGVRRVGLGAAAAGQYAVEYIPAAANAPATGVVLARDLAAAADAQVSNAADLSAHTFVFEVMGT